MEVRVLFFLNREKDTICCRAWSRRLFHLWNRGRLFPRGPTSAFCTLKGLFSSPLHSPFQYNNHAILPKIVLPEPLFPTFNPIRLESTPNPTFLLVFFLTPSQIPSIFLNFTIIDITISPLHRSISRFSNIDSSFNSYKMITCYIYQYIIWAIKSKPYF